MQIEKKMHICRNRHIYNKTNIGTFTNRCYKPSTKNLTYRGFSKILDEALKRILLNTTLFITCAYYN